MLAPPPLVPAPPRHHSLFSAAAAPWPPGSQAFMSPPSFPGFPLHVPPLYATPALAQFHAQPGVGPGLTHLPVPMLPAASTVHVGAPRLVHVVAPYSCTTYGFTPFQRQQLEVLMQSHVQLLVQVGGWVGGSQVGGPQVGESKMMEQKGGRVLVSVGRG